MQENHTLRLNAGAVIPRDYYERINVGGACEFMRALALRAGYPYPTDEQGVSLGAGLNLSVAGYSFHADHMYARFGAFGEVNRFAFRFGF